MALLAAYSFDESGTTVVDCSGNGNNFTFASTDSARNAAGHTNGGLSWADTAGGPPVLPDIGRTANRTIMAWLRDVPLLGASWSVIFLAPSISSGAWGILWLADGSIYIQARNSTTFARASATLPGDGAWHHVAGTYDGSTIRCYVDGVEGTSAALTGPLRTDTDPPQLLLDWTSVTPIMDDLRLYDETLSGAAISTAMNTPVAITVAIAAPAPLATVSVPGNVIDTGALAATAPLAAVSVPGTVTAAGLLSLGAPAAAVSMTGTVSAAGPALSAVALTELRQARCTVETLKALVTV